MQVCRFLLKGETACFRNPDVNQYCHFTYGHIHKMALLGMFGAILGLNGYSELNQKLKFKRCFPEWYEKLKDMKVAVFPKNKNGVFSKKMQNFIESVGFSNSQNGPALLQVREQWLEKPEWEIVFLLDSKMAWQVATALQNQTCVYMPYLGKSEHPAAISDVRVEAIDMVRADVFSLDCLVRATDVSFAQGMDFTTMLYQEELPIGFSKNTKQYDLCTFWFTDGSLALPDHYQMQDGRHVLFV